MRTDRFNELDREIERDWRRAKRLSVAWFAICGVFSIALLAVILWAAITLVQWVTR